MNIHMITGLTGAGKSTYAEELRIELGGVRFSIDEWNASLFFMDREPTSDFDWFYERVQRCCAQMRSSAEQILSANVPVIFDCGFTNLEERKIFYNWAKANGYSVTLHFVDVPSDIRWKRVQLRNAEKGDTYMLDVTRDMFDFIQSLWEAPEADEMAEYNGQLINN